MWISPIVRPKAGVALALKFSLSVLNTDPFVRKFGTAGPVCGPSPVNLRQAPLAINSRQKRVIT